MLSVVYQFRGIPQCTRVRRLVTHEGVQLTPPIYLLSSSDLIENVRHTYSIGLFQAL